jgi:peptidoglycan/xylan/chitin deacetylase (PgdA/CDA1 family)
MSNWLDAVRKRLDEIPQPVTLFFRDDDAGWGDAQLYHLLDLFARYNLPIDLAAIPMAVTPALARELLNRIAASAEKVRIHQHGYSHTNHESQGRKCEFGASRNKASQRRDILAGNQRLQGLFGGRVDPIFTPPWNRCTLETGECLLELGIRVVSRESGADPLGISGLTELPIEIDWFAHRKKVRLLPVEWAQHLASKLASTSPIGIMFHHAVMGIEEMAAASELLEALAGHPNVRFNTILDTVRTWVPSAL